MRELTLNIQLSGLFEVEDYTMTAKELEAFQDQCIGKLLKQMLDRENLGKEYVDAEWDREIYSIKRSPNPPEHFVLAVKEVRWVGNGIVFYNENCKVSVIKH